MSRFNQYLEIAIAKCNKCGEGMSETEYWRGDGLCSKCAKEEEGAAYYSGGKKRKLKRGELVKGGK